jgi:hypothetical protein
MTSFHVPPAVSVYVDINDICHSESQDDTEIAATIATLGPQDTEALIDKAVAATVSIRVLYAALHHYVMLAHAETKKPPPAEAQPDPYLTTDT